MRGRSPQDSLRSRPCAPSRGLPSTRAGVPFAALLVAALVALLTVSFGPGAAAGVDDARQVPVRVASFNIHAGIGADGRFDLRRTAAAIRATGADVVGLQEVDVHWGSRSDWRNEARALADMLGMRVFFAPIYSLDPPAPGEPRREYGLAILSRYPIVHAVNHEITRLSTQSPGAEPAPAPGFPEVVLNVRGARVHVYNTHLDYRGDPTIRRQQVGDMLAIMAADKDEQQVLVGDFNAEHGAPELGGLWDHLDDAWPAGGAGGGNTYPAADPVKRIDYVTVTPGIDIRSAAVPDTGASDHRPVVAELTLTRGTPIRGR